MSEQNEQSGTLPEVLDVNEVAALLKVSVPTVRRWVHDGKLKPVSLGRRQVFEVESIREFFEQSKREDHDNASA
jgi:excisionase family DNA binding protein